MDLFLKKIIAYKVSWKNDVSLTVKTLKTAFERNHQSNLNFHNDQESNYTVNKYIQFLWHLKSRTIIF